MDSPIDAARIACGLIVLAFAARLDLATRRVANAVWVEGVAVAAILLVWDSVVYGGVTWWDVVFSGAFALFGYAAWRARLIGGADAKAFMFLAVLLPTPLDVAEGGLRIPWWPGAMPAAVDVYLYALAAFLLLPVALLLRNVARGDARLPHALFGYTMPLAEIEKRPVWLLEEPRANGATRLRLAATRWTPEAHARAVEALRASGRARAWVTPKLPFVVFLLAGFVLASTLGEPWLH